jgi:predicted HicB family RNase H-like nuclease
LDANESDAFDGIRQLTADVVVDMVAAGETPPPPLSGREFSGKLLVRITPELHKKLATEAADSNVSLNRLISARLAHTA